MLLDVAQGVRAGSARDDGGRARRRCARRRRGDARPLAPALPPLRKGREDGRDLRRRAPRARAVRRADRDGRLDRGLRPRALRLGLLDPCRSVACRSPRSCSASPGPCSSSRARRPSACSFCTARTSRACVPEPRPASSCGGRPPAPKSGAGEPLAQLGVVLERAALLELAAQLPDRAVALGEHVVGVDRLEVHLA